MHQSQERLRCSLVTERPVPCIPHDPVWDDTCTNFLNRNWLPQPESNTDLIELRCATALFDFNTAEYGLDVGIQTCQRHSHGQLPTSSTPVTDCTRKRLRPHHPVGVFSKEPPSGIEPLTARIQVGRETTRYVRMEPPQRP